jgi:hypothetical protein
MADDVKRVTTVVDGRTLTLHAPGEEQVLAWMGLAGSLSEDLTERDPGEVTEDVTLIMDALLGLFETDEDRRWFRRAAVLGRAKLSDLMRAVVDDAEQAAVVKTGPKPRVRRAGGR